MCVFRSPRRPAEFYLPHRHIALHVPVLSTWLQLAVVTIFESCESWECGEGYSNVQEPEAGCDVDVGIDAEIDYGYEFGDGLSRRLESSSSSCFEICCVGELIICLRAW